MDEKLKWLTDTPTEPLGETQGRVCNIEAKVDAIFEFLKRWQEEGSVPKFNLEEHVKNFHRERQTLHREERQRNL